MRVLLTGHKGFIGSKLKQRLEHLQFEVIGIDKQDGNDLLDCELPNDVSFVIPSAGKSGVRQSMNDPGGYWINNVEVSKRLFKNIPTLEFCMQTETNMNSI